MKFTFAQRVGADMSHSMTYDATGTRILCAAYLYTEQSLIFQGHLILRVWLFAWGTFQQK